MFAERRIADDEYQRLLFEWCQPQITAFCQERDLPYPQLGEDGELADPQGFSDLVNGRR
jgi:tRNA (guanosine-2'-O-)-methyltransferase